MSRQFYSSNKILEIKTYAFGLLCECRQYTLPLYRYTQEVYVKTLMEPNGHQRTKKKDYILQESNELKLLNDEEVDPWTAWAYKPRTITLLLLGACLLM